MKRGLGVVACLLLGACGQEVEVDSDINTIDEIVVCKGVQDDACMTTLHRIQELLPLEIQDIITDSSVRIEIYSGAKEDFLNYMSDKRIHDKSVAYSGIAGYGYEDKTVVYSLAYDYVLMHELGHAYEYSFWYDGVKDNPSSSEEWYDAYMTEYISSYGTTSVEEFYAECFAMYFRTPKMLHKLCPKAYSLLDEDFKDME